MTNDTVVFELLLLIFALGILAVFFKVYEIYRSVKQERSLLHGENDRTKRALALTLYWWIWDGNQGDGTNEHMFGVLQQAAAALGIEMILLPESEDLPDGGFRMNPPLSQWLRQNDLNTRVPPELHIPPTVTFNNNQE